MTDQSNPALTGENGAAVTGGEATPQHLFSENTPLSDFPPAIQEYVKALRTESRTRKDAIRAAETAAKKAEEARLVEQQEWKTLAENRQAQLDKLQPIAEQHEAITAAFNASLDNRLKQIPEDVRKRTVDPIRVALSPVEFSNWLDANMDILRARQAPPLDGGAGSTASSGKTVQLTSDQIEMAKASGMSLDEYAKYLNRVNENKGSAWQLPK